MTQTMDFDASTTPDEGTDSGKAKPPKRRRRALNPDVYSGPSQIQLMREVMRQVLRQPRKDT
jgi:hypothetical protein